jgi:Flp pilus assembly protein TadG
MPEPQRPRHPGILRAVSRLLSDRKGLSGVEFALILPIIITILAASEDLGQALMVDRRMNQIAATASDIVSQQSNWSGTSLDGILTGTATIIQPFSTSKLTILVAVVNVDSSLNATVSWSRGYNTTALTAGAASPVTLSSTILQSGVQMIVSKATYSLTTPFAALLKPVTGLSSYTYTRYGINRPRVSDTITYSGS